MSSDNPVHAYTIYALTAAGFALSAPCFVWFAVTKEIPLLLLGLVTFGMSYDFLSHVLGMHLGRHEKFLEIYSRVNFSALCFGIPFTAFAGTFVVAAVNPESISADLAANYLVILHGSVLFGLLFMVARYKRVEVHGAVEYVLDKSHGYTKFIFVTRRVLLAASLVIGILVMVDAWNTEWRLWSLLFGGVFIASVPLHILHKQIPSMWTELITQALAVYASWQVFVA